MQLLPAVVRRHPRTTAATALVGIGLVVFGLVWFEPQKLFIEDRVNEPLPGQGVDPIAGEGRAEAGGTEAGTRVVAKGDFLGLEHETSGRALIVEAPDGRRFLRFEGFETSNGPDLVVYLSAKAPAGPEDWYGYDRDFVALGELKGNIGPQNYEIPPRVDLERYSTAVVWCRRFTVGFAAAVLLASPGAA